ncbi:MAG: LlaJI family restriction endonuclease [Bacteroidales bacterium]|nr:LlaJI family restriction endonuclease [Bacteroidales bacterium]
MKLLIEGYKYSYESKEDLVYKVFQGIVSPIELEAEKGSISQDYVGYFYNKECDDVVFFLPKVVLTGGKKKTTENGESIITKETVFGVTPEDLIELFGDSNKKESDKKDTRLALMKEFLSELAIWIYRTIDVFGKNHKDSGVLSSKDYKTNGGNKAKEKFQSLFDVILALRDFNRENSSYLTFIARSAHSGHNKIEWRKTISKVQPFMQDGSPIYMDIISKKKNINFDEELLIIYFSILAYIKEQYGFKLAINLNYPLITGSKFESLRKGKGVKRLKAIKYKYFSDTNLRIWHLCYAFFDTSHNIALNKDKKEFLLVHSFQNVFEAIIDDLLGDKNIAKGLKSQRDNKRVDHLYVDESLIKAREEEVFKTYYISDSKYYSLTEIETINKKESKDEQEKETTIKLRDDSIYKQFTYARNIIQWNMDLFLAEDREVDKKLQPELRPDELTEGYNVMPNFFLSAFIPLDEKSNQDNSTSFKLTKKDFENGRIGWVSGKVERNRQFIDRLFDRDTLLLGYYNINFLFVVWLYGRDNSNRQAEWRTSVRNEFKQNALKILAAQYEFSVLLPHKLTNVQEYINRNFKRLIGKIYRPQPQEKNEDEYLILAHQNEKADEEAQKALINDLKHSFYIGECKVGEDELLDKALRGALESIKQNIEKESSCEDTTFIFTGSNNIPLAAEDGQYNKSILIGCFKSKEHLKWIAENKLYNVRANIERRGATERKVAQQASHLLLYNYHNPSQCYFFELADTITLEGEGSERMKLYPGYKTGNEYYLYHIVGQLDSREIDVVEVINKYRPYNWETGAPIYVPSYMVDWM